jgi:signal-transduction protein with cAMP-binding, CBS, and nucleotidyltransferase domain
MKVKEAMSVNPACCTPNDTAHSLAKMTCDLNVGSIPVVVDHQSRALVGMITDPDLCCRVLAQVLDAISTRIQEFITYNPAVCRDGENVEQWERFDARASSAPNSRRRQGQPRDRHRLAG